MAGVLSLEVKTPAGERVAQFDILPMSSLPTSVLAQQYGVARYVAGATGLKLYFVVTTDRIVGWVVGEPSPRIEMASPEILSLYAGGDVQKVSAARSGYLSALVEAWLGDLNSRWKSGPNPAPGETDLASAGILDTLRVGDIVATGQP